MTIAAARRSGTGHAAVPDRGDSIMDRRELAQLVGLGLIGGTALATPQVAQAQQAARSRLHQALERGTLRVGTTGDFNPMSFRDTASNAYQGFDIEAMTALATDMGLRV